MIVLRPQPPQKYHIHNECYGNSKLDSCIIIRVGLESFIIDSNFFCSQPRTPTANKMSGQAAQIKNLCQIFIFSTDFCSSNVFGFCKFLCSTAHYFNHTKNIKMVHISPPHYKIKVIIVTVVHRNISIMLMDQILWLDSFIKIYFSIKFVYRYIKMTARTRHINVANKSEMKNSKYTSKWWYYNSKQFNLQLLYLTIWYGYRSTPN